MVKETSRNSPIEVYYLYAPTSRDEALFQELERHLKIFEHTGRITGWHRGKIQAGSNHMQELTVHLERAQVILLLISPDFLASEEVYSIEMEQALARHALHEICVIPILLRPVYYKNAPFAHLKMLPDNHEPIITWALHDEAFTNIAHGLNQVLNDLDKDQIRSTVPPTQKVPSIPLSSLSETRRTIHLHGLIQGLVIGEQNTVNTNFQMQSDPLKRHK